MSDTTVFIEGGVFEMGHESLEDETIPVHTVEVKSFYIDAYQVTQKLYQSVLGNNPSYFDGDNHPVDGVDWYEAVLFCNQYSLICKLDPVYDIQK